jgi:uncharacterized protein YbaR (Trm112 family)/ubiquinone/menaquinone biosynthesis C-methylase UbiE
MKYRLFDFIQCPDCKGQFEIQVFKSTDITYNSDILVDNNSCPANCKNPDISINKTEEAQSHCKKCYETEILEGLLTCQCGKVYPIVRGIPRFLPDAFDQHPEFTSKYYEHIDKQNINANLKEKEHFLKMFKKTQESFGFQWKNWGKEKRIYGYTDNENRDWFLTTLTSKKIDASYFKGKTVLEVGCGHGRFVKIVNELGSENIGMDLGPSVEIVYELTKDKPTAHVIQGNAMYPPIKDDSFDYVWSHGVLHHTPSTTNAFKAVSHLPKKDGGWFYIWVYPKKGFFWEYGNRFVRYFTTRLPEKVLYGISFILVPLLYLIPAYNRHVNPSNVSWKECALSVNDWLGPKYQWHHTDYEVMAWFKDREYKDIEVLPTTGCAVTGVRK